MFAVLGVYVEREDGGRATAALTVSAGDQVWKEFTRETERGLGWTFDDILRAIEKRDDAKLDDLLHNYMESFLLVAAAEVPDQVLLESVEVIEADPEDAILIEKAFHDSGTVWEFHMALSEIYVSVDIDSDPYGESFRRAREALREHLERISRSNPRDPTWELAWEYGLLTVDQWFERDRAMVSLTDRETGEEYATWWDEDVFDLIEHGFFKPDKGRSVAAYLDHLGKPMPRSLARRLKKKMEGE